MKDEDRGESCNPLSLEREPEPRLDGPDESSRFTPLNNFFYPHSSFVEFEQPSNSHEPSELVSLHPSVLLVQNLDFLRFDSRTMGFGTSVRIALHMEPS
jgi:hypothetical protein